jgi:hypothetical protein
MRLTYLDIAVRLWGCGAMELQCWLLVNNRDWWRVFDVLIVTCIINLYFLLFFFVGISINLKYTVPVIHLRQNKNI